MRYRVIASVVVGALLAGALSLAALGPRAAWFGAARAQASAATWFEVHASEGVTTVYFVGWTVGDVLTLTMDDPQTPKSPDYVTQVKARGAEDAAGGFAVEVDYAAKGGDVCTVTDGTTSKSLIVTAFTVTGVDLSADTVTGTAAPGSVVYVACLDSARAATADTDGRWLADFSTPPADPKPGTTPLRTIGYGMTVRVEQHDADGDRTVIEWPVRLEPMEWTEIKPSGAAPEARWGHSMAFDPVSGRAILFGGQAADIQIAAGSAGHLLGDTWAYDPDSGRWSPIPASGPPPRSGGALVYDEAAKRLILFGGEGAEGPLDDTWAYDPATDQWTQLFPSGTIPESRSGHAMAYLPSTGTIVLFGGTQGPAGRELDDTWIYDFAAHTWTAPAPNLPPVARYGASLWPDPASGGAVLFGGAGDKPVEYHAWAYDPAANTWSKVRPVSGSISRTFVAVAYDPTRPAVFFVGGHDGSSAPRIGTRVGTPDGASWADVSTSVQPPALTGAALVYDPAGKRLILFGGDTGSGLSAATWVLAAATPVPGPATEPPSIFGRVPLPGQLSFGAKTIATNAILGSVFAVIFGLTSTLFNSTLKANRGRIAAGLASLQRRLPRMKRRRGRAAPAEGGRPAIPGMVRPVREWLARIGIVLLTALIYCFLQPGFGATLGSLGTFAIFVVTVSVTTFCWEGVQALVGSRRYATPARLKVFLPAIAIAVFCVLVSRALDFRPGILYGFVAGLVFLGGVDPDMRTRARLTLVASASLLVVSLVAWGIAIPLRSAVPGDASSLGLPASICLAVFSGGLQGVVFRLVPLDFMPGGALLRWNRWVWGALFGLSMFLVCWVLLNPSSSFWIGGKFLSGGIILAAGVLAFWTMVTLGTWLYFRLTEKKMTVPPSESSPEESAGS